MKKKLRALLIITLTLCIAFLSSVTMGGCSDFDFNPIGKWKLTSDKTYLDGKLYLDNKPGYMLMDAGEGKEPVPVYMGDLIYTFTKSGTGIISVYNDVTGQSYDAQDFTYEYDEKNVVLHISDDHSRREKLDPVKMVYSIEKKDGSIILKSQDKYTVKDTDGKDHKGNDVKILSKY